MPGRTGMRSRAFGSLGFNKSTNQPIDKKQELKERYDPAAAGPQQENINANTQNKLREPMRNLMFDPRVVRGSQFPHKSKAPPDDPAPRRHHVYASSRLKKTNIVAYSDEPAPIRGRKHCDIQTDAYLEELTEEIPDFNAETQTDPFLDRPATPLFIPWKSGPDKWTQIYEGDLFDFDMEVEAMLEVLCGRTIEQAVMEVMEDHQLAHIRMHQDRFEQLRIAEMVAAEQLEAAHKRAIQEKERRKEQEKKRLMEEQRLRERLEAEVFARHYIHDLKEEVMENLRRKGWFFDPRQREIEQVFIPSMLEGVWNHIEDIIRSRFALSYMVDQVLCPDEVPIIEELPPPYFPLRRNPSPSPLPSEADTTTVAEGTSTAVTQGMSATGTGTSAPVAPLTPGAAPAVAQRTSMRLSPTIATQPTQGTTPTGTQGETPALTVVASVTVTPGQVLTLPERIQSTIPEAEVSTFSEESEETTAIESQDLDLDSFDEIIEGEDMFGDVIDREGAGGFPRPVVSTLGGTELVAGGQVTGAVAETVNLAQEASNLVDQMLKQLRPITTQL